ncbi:MAG: MarP family serine protease [Microthrixaceae bacterium]
MNGLDLLLLLAAVVAVVGGWRLGLVTRALGWFGALIGGAIGVVVVPALTRWIDPSTDGGVLLLTAGGLILLVSLGQALGVAVGARMRPTDTSGRIHLVDSIGGSILGIVGVVILIWLLAPLAASTTGWVASATRSSTFARAVTDHLPPPPESLQNLERSLVDGNFPQLFTDLAPAPEVPAPPTGSPITAAQLEVLASSALRIQGEACSVMQSGSGFSIGDGYWVTNAHVVAGTSSLSLSTARGDTGSGRVVFFDPDWDIAVVASNDLSGPPLEFADGTPEDAGLVLGFPGGGRFQPSPFIIGEELAATGYDIYDRSLVRRDLLVLASELEPGDSGSAVVNGDGDVVGLAVAVAPDRPGVAYALDSTGVQRRLAEGLDPGTNQRSVSTGPCL